MGFGQHYGQTYRKVYRDDQQHCEWINSVDPTNKSLTQSQKVLRRVEETTKENMRGELEKREGRIRLTELIRAAAAKEHIQKKVWRLEHFPLEEKAAHSKSNQPDPSKCGAAGNGRRPSGSMRIAVGLDRSNDGAGEEPGGKRQQDAKRQQERKQ